jgi:hypothetical protein
MKEKYLISNALLRAAAAVVVSGITTTVAIATEPCGDFGECKVLIELNTTDGDIGFHFLVDGDDLVKIEGKNPDGKKFFKADAKKEFREQFMTETFVESAEPVCREELAEDDGDIVVTLEEFLERWSPGTYAFKGKANEGEKPEGETVLTHYLPAAPDELEFDGSVISWESGDDLGECATNAELAALVDDEVLPEHPENVVVAAWEVVFEPDVEDGDPTGSLKFTIRVAGNIGVTEVTVPAEYLASLPFNTPAKIEVGAIGGEDNASFTEVDGICVNEVDDGCEDEDEDE